MNPKYNYKKIQEMRAMLIEEMKQTFPTITCDVLIFVEHRVQTAIMAGLFDKDIKDEVQDKRSKN